MALPSRSSSLQKRLMITSVATLMASMVVVLFLIWFVTDSSTSPIGVVITTSSDFHPLLEETVTIQDFEGSVEYGSADYRWQLLRLGLIVLALMFGVAVVAAWILNRRMFDRIGSITAIAQTMDEHHLGARFDTSHKNDEIDHMATAINAALDRLQGGFERQRMFVRSASHELRTPLTVARTALEMPLVEGRVPVDLTDDVTDALAAQFQLEQLLDTLLMLSQGGTDAPRSIAVDGVVRKLVEMERQRTDVPEVTWRLKLDTVTAPVSPRAFEIIMANVLSNAVTHNRDQGWCEVRLHQTEGSITITVENSGGVVSPELLERILQPFVKGETSPGTGLGLAVVEQMTTALAGHISITAREAGGLQVTLEIPDQAETDAFSAPKPGSAETEA